MVGVSGCGKSRGVCCPIIAILDVGEGGGEYIVELRVTFAV